jgi:hypothetical protein
VRAPADGAFAFVRAGAARHRRDNRRASIGGMLRSRLAMKIEALIIAVLVVGVRVSTIITTQCESGVRAK